MLCGDSKLEKMKFNTHNLNFGIDFDIYIVNNQIRQTV